MGVTIENSRIFRRNKVQGAGTVVIECMNKTPHHQNNAQQQAQNQDVFNHGLPLDARFS